MIKIKHRTIICPQNATDEITLESVKAAFGITTDPPQDPPTDPPQDPPTDPPQDPPADPPEDPPKDPPTDPPADPPVDRTAQAFAAMRVQNKEYQKILNGVAKVLGVKDTSNPDVMLTSLNDLLTKAQAKEQNVPEEVFKRLQTLEAKDQEYTQKEIKETAYLGFQKVKDTFKLDNAQLNKFADELVAAGINPFETKVDILKEYQTMHFQDLIAAAAAEGAKLEAERAVKAAAHGSDPGKKQGQGGSDPEKITTIAQLNDWFDQQAK